MITRVVALKDATVTGLAISSCYGAGTAFDLGALESAQTAYAGLHILSTAAGANTILVHIVSGSSSGFTTAGANPGTERFLFTAVSCRDGQWAAPITGAFATCQRFWRMEWATTCGSRKLLTWMSRSCDV